MTNEARTQATERTSDLSDWTNEVLDQLLPEKQSRVELKSVSGDASFRRYFRAECGQRSFIAVDAPIASEDSQTFVRIADLFRAAGVCTPEVISTNFEQGFMLLDDFGDNLYLADLLKFQQQNAADATDKLYGAAIRSLLSIQQHVDSSLLDPFDREKLLQEMALFEQWFCLGLLNLELAESDQMLIEDTVSLLAQAAVSQTQVAVHRDYHSRNLMLLDSSRFGAESGPGIIDFQDAVAGAYTYDLVSLLRDCYIRWQPQQVNHWALLYFSQAKSAGIIGNLTEDEFLRDFDLMGLQRNLKVMGIFARLNIRDHKPQFLADIPLVIRNFLEVSEKYPDLANFRSWFTDTVLPVAREKLEL